MRRTEQAQGLRLMKFEEAYGRMLRRELSQVEAAEMLGMSERSFRRWRDRFEAEGTDGLYDRRLGRLSARRAPMVKVARVLELFERVNARGQRGIVGVLAPDAALSVVVGQVLQIPRADAQLERARERGRAERRCGECRHQHEPVRVHGRASSPTATRAWHDSGPSGGSVGAESAQLQGCCKHLQ